MTMRTINNPDEPATYKQVAYIGRILLEKAGKAAITKGEAKILIDEILNGEGASMFASDLVNRAQESVK